MDAVHVHLALNHVPVVGLGFALLTLIAGLARGDERIQRLGLAFLVVIGVTAFAVRLTGEGAEEAVENLPGVTETVIGRHEQAANLAAVFVSALGLVALAGVLAWRRGAPRWFHAGMLALVIAGGAMMAYAANLGGQIRHTEIRGAVGAAAAEAESERSDD